MSGVLVIFVIITTVDEFFYLDLSIYAIDRDSSCLCSYNIVWGIIGLFTTVDARW